MFCSKQHLALISISISELPIVYCWGARTKCYVWFWFFYGCFSKGKDSFKPGRKHEKICAGDPEAEGLNLCGDKASNAWNYGKSSRSSKKLKVKQNLFLVLIETHVKWSVVTATKVNPYLISFKKISPFHIPVTD